MVMCAPMNPLGIGLVGARYGARMHLANYAKLPREIVEIRGVCSRTKESGDAFAKEARTVLLRGKLDLRAANRQNAAADRGFQRLDPGASRRRKSFGLKLRLFTGLEIDRRWRVVAHGRAFGRGVSPPETMGRPVAF